MRPGLPMAQAAEMARYSRPAQTFAHDAELDQQTLEYLAGDLQRRISPLVAIEALDDKPWDGRTIHQQQVLLCDISGVTHLFGGEQQLLQATRRRLEHYGLNAQMAIADNVAVAWALAHYREMIVPPGIDLQQQSQLLAPLPVQALRIPAATTYTLGRLGVTRIGELLRLPRAGLATRLGTHLVKRISQLLGEVDEPLQVHRQQAEHEASLLLEYPTADQAILADRVAKLIQKVRAGLVQHQRGALRVVCHLALLNHPPLTLEVGFFAPTMDADHILGLLLQGFENRQLPDLVSKITLSIPLAAPLRHCQNSLFDDGKQHTGIADQSLARMIDGLSGRLGRDAVLGIVGNDNPLPEKSYELYPLTGATRQLGSTARGKSSKRNKSSAQKYKQGTMAQRLSRKSLQPHRQDALRRPIHLLGNPTPLAVTKPAATSSCPPEAIRIGGKVHEVLRFWGPERIETDWWQGPCVRRDYFRIETDSGDWWWIYRNLNRSAGDQTASADRRSQWMLHGRFA